MCGILGYVQRPGVPPVAEARALAARDRMVHRGPDDAGIGFLEGGRVLLAHRRLSIQDRTEAGRQPMHVPGRDLAIAYNGEVYNFLDLRARLAASGVRFRSRTDTEVVLALYAELGDAFVHCLRGMFAFAIWDGEKKRLLCGRDRVGKKPLYYAETARGLAFASTIPALLELGWVEPRLREEIVPEYLAMGRVGAPDTLLEGISKLPPGHVLIYEGGVARTVRFDEPEFFDEPLRGRDAKLAATLRESVRLRLISDVPVGVTLSGGVDSSLVAALIAEHREVPLRTFTVGFEGEEEYNEAVHARRTAEWLGAEHHECWLSAGDVIEALPEVERHIDEPHPNLIWLATYFVCRLARENGVTVVLTGDGGDELFFGYERWKTLLDAHRRWLRPVEAMPGPVRGLAGRAAAGLVRDEAAREMFLRASRGDPIYWGPMYFYPGGMARLLSPRGRALVRSHPPGARWRQVQRDLARPLSLEQWMRRTGLRGHLVEDFLARLDRMGMATSVEGRAPLLDHEVVRLALRWPTADLVEDGVGKAPLRRLVGTLYPKEIIDRPKMGFCAPVHSWLHEGLRQTSIEGLETLADGIDLFRADALRRWIEAPPADKREAGRLWALVSLGRWWKRMRGHGGRTARLEHGEVPDGISRHQRA